MDNIVEIKATQLPCGNYKAEFLGTEMTDHEEYGAGIRWKFQVIDENEFEGFETSKTTAPHATTKNGTGRILAAISGLGRIDPTLGKVDLSTYIGQVYALQVIENSNGGTKIDSIQPSQF